MKKLIKRLKILLSEMAETRNDAIEYLVNQSRPFYKHVCKIMLWGNQNDEWFEHWSDEIYHFIKNADDIILKGNKRLKRKDYEKYFFFFFFLSSCKLEVRLKQIIDEFTQRNNYPEQDYVDIKQAHQSFLIFVKNILDLMEQRQLTFNAVMEECKQLKEIV